MLGALATAVWLAAGGSMTTPAEETAKAVPITVGVELAPGWPAVRDVAVEVELTPSGSSAGVPTKVTVAAPGSHRVDLGAGSVWQLRARAPGYFSPETLVAVDAQRPPAVRLLLYPTGALEARVRPPRDGPPPAQLQVRFAPAPGAGELPQATIACPVERGRWRCEVPAGLLDLRIHAPGLIPFYRWGEKITAGRIVSLGELQLKRGASVAGRIETVNGVPPDHACRVRLEARRLAGPGSRAEVERMRATALEARSNPRGWFEFSGVPPGSYAVKLEEKGFAPVERAPIVVEEGLQLELLEPLVLAPPLGLEVEISPPLGPSEQPWRLRLSRRLSGDDVKDDTRHGTASREGRWRQSNLAPGRYLLFVTDDHGNQWASEEVEVARGAPPVTIEVGGVEVRGRVLLGHDPVAATLWFGGRRGGQRIRMEADEKGKFTGVLPRAGKWPVDVSADALAGITPTVKVEVPAGKRVAEIEIRIPDTRLAGDVVDSQGTPAAGASVHLMTGEGGETTADAAGKFAFRGVPSGAAGLEASLGDETSGPVQATIAEGSDSPTVHLVLGKQLVLHGTVATGSGPVPGAMLIGVPSVATVPFGRSAQAQTDVTGSFELRVPQGTQTLTLFVFALGYAMRMLPVTVDPAQFLDIAVEPAGGTLVLEVPAGPPAVVVHGDAFSLESILGMWARMQGSRPPDAGGPLVVPNVEAGPYSLCVQKGALRSGSAPPASQCASGMLAPQGRLELRLPRGGS